LVIISTTGVLGSGGVNRPHDVGRHEALLDAPAPQPGDIGVDVEDGLRRQLDLSARGGTVRLAEILVAQPGKEVNQLAARDRVERGILRLRFAPLRMTFKVGLEFSEGRAIIADGVGAHAGRACEA
jgi:hypothetical protein